MKRIVLCVLGVMLLLTASVAAAEITTCTHPNMKELTSERYYQQLEAGHYEVIKSVVKCEDCGIQRLNDTKGQFTGHVFYMAESLHLYPARYHICIFICGDCHMLMLCDFECVGGEPCNKYEPQAGEIPKVQLLYSLEGWFEEYSEEAVVDRWLEKQPAATS